MQYSGTHWVLFCFVLKAKQYIFHVWSSSQKNILWGHLGWLIRWTSNTVTYKGVNWGETLLIILRGVLKCDVVNLLGSDRSRISLDVASLTVRQRGQCFPEIMSLAWSSSSASETVYDGGFVAMLRQKWSCFVCDAGSNSNLISVGLIRKRALNLGICMKNPDGLISSCD